MNRTTRQRAVLTVLSAFLLVAVMESPVMTQDTLSTLQKQFNMNGEQTKDLITILDSNEFLEAKKFGIDAVDAAVLATQPEDLSQQQTALIGILAKNAETLIKSGKWQGSVLQRRYGVLLQSNFPSRNYAIDGLPELQDDMQMKKLLGVIGKESVEHVSGDFTLHDGTQDLGDVGTGHPLAITDLGGETLVTLQGDSRFYLEGVGSFPGVGLVIGSSSIFDKGDGRLRLKVTPYHPEGKTLCADQYFAKYIAAEGTSCTGFLAKVDHVNSGDPMLITAKHCFGADKLDAADTKVLFGFRTQRLENGKIVHKQSYDPQFVISLGNQVNLVVPDGADIIAFDMSGKIPDGLVPYEIDMSDSLPDPAKRLILVGHPTGLPQQIDNQVIEFDRPDTMTMRVSADAFHGNSGSPIFDMTLKKVKGMISNGLPDYELLSEQNCDVHVVTQQASQTQEKALLLSKVFAPTLAESQQ